MLPSNIYEGLPKSNYKFDINIYILEKDMCISTIAQIFDLSTVPVVLRIYKTGYECMPYLYETDISCKF